MKPDFGHFGTPVGRVWHAPLSGPCVVTLREGQVVDITARNAPTVRDICEMEDPAEYAQGAEGVDLGSIEEIAANTTGDVSQIHFLAPCDLQAVKARGVTFASSMVERVIEERASGDPQLSNEIRERVGAAIGDSLRKIEAGSAQASTWSNPESEVVQTVSSMGRIVGATLGNDVNLRDVEGCSALLLFKAKDNNASCAIGPMIYERDLQTICVATQDTEEARKAFTEKRTPHFIGK